MATTRQERRQRRVKHIRRLISGTLQKPRLSVYRSNRYLFVQAIDDVNNKVLAALSEKMVVPVKDEKPIDRAGRMGSLFGEMLKKLNVEEIVFDRGGYKFHGRIAQFADSVRKVGIKF